MSTPSRPTGTMKIKGSKCVLKSVSYRMGPPWRLPKFAIGSRFWHRCEWEDTPCSSYAKFYSRSHLAVIRVDAGNVIEAHEHASRLRKRSLAKSLSARLANRCTICPQTN